MRAEQRAAPRGELTPEISKLRLDAETVLMWERKNHREDPLAFAHLQRFARAILALSGPPAGQESRDTVLLDWLEEQRVVQVTFAERDALFTPDSDFGLDVRAAIEGAIAIEVADEAGESGWTERDGDSPPEPVEQGTPDFDAAREAVNGLDTTVREVASIFGEPTRYRSERANRVRATLDQAEAEIARLREENAAARCEALALFNAMDHGPAEPLDTVAGIISQISNMVAGLRPPVETAQQQALEVLREMVDAMHRYQMDVDEPPPFRHREMMAKAEALLAPSVLPSVPKEDK